MTVSLPDISYLAEMGVLTKPVPTKALQVDEIKRIRVIKVQQWRKNNPEAYAKARLKCNRKQRARYRKWSPERKQSEKIRIRKWQKNNKEWLREYRKQWNAKQTK